jgi:hypothetical protein
VTDRIASDHEAVETVRATLERVGRTDRVQVCLPAARSEVLPTDDVVRLVVDGAVTHAPADVDFDGRPTLSGAFDSPTLARDPGDGRDRLQEWVADDGIAIESTVLVDVVSPGHTYGLRSPGERVIYEATEPPSDSLAAIARDLDE